MNFVHRFLVGGAVSLLASALHAAQPPGVPPPKPPGQARAAVSLPDARDVQLGGSLGLACERSVQRLSEDPYRSPAYLRSDFSFETNRIFVNYSGDISGRFIELASLLSPPGQMQPATLAEVMRDLGGYQKADGHFGRDVNWNEPLEPESPNAKLLPIFWGNSRLLVGLIEACQNFARPDLLEAAKRLGDFYIATADRFLDPAREPEYRMTGSYAAGYVTDYFPGIEGLTRLYQATKDSRYLQQAERMAAFFQRFDTLPIDHSHGNLTTHRGLLLLYEITGEQEYLERAQRRWREAIAGGYVWPMGGVGEKFLVSYPTDEGCSEADWLWLNLNLWRLTGERRCLEMAERLVWNHYAMNRTTNGGYGHHNFVCDPDGPLLVKPEFTEAVWCCTFHGSLGMQTLKRYVVTSSERGVFINFPLSVNAPVSTAKGYGRVVVSAEEQPGKMTCAVRWQAGNAKQTPPDVFFRIPSWAERVTVLDPCGSKLKAATVEGYLRLPGKLAAQGELRLGFEFSPRVEDRRLSQLKLDRTQPTPLRGVTLWDGPHLLLANCDQPRPAVAVHFTKDGHLVLRRAAASVYRLDPLPRLDARDEAIPKANGSRSALSLLPWEYVRHDAPAAFVFDLVTLR